jgi:release factor glutamine methyltransferase
MTLGGLLMQGTKMLNENGIDDAAKEAELLLTCILKIKRIDLYINSQSSADETTTKEFNKGINRRIKREPISYITGKHEFLDLDLLVDKRVLIPRPETEQLVEEVFKTLEKKSGNYKVLDLCTGSGAIALAIANKFDSFEITASDISSQALSVAKKNAVKLKLENRIKFIKSDLFKSFKKTDRYNMITCNPPYIPTKEYNNLMPDVRLFEPKLALDAGKDGLKYYRAIIKSAVNHLEDKGILAFEIGYGQSYDIKNIFIQSKKYDILRIIRDYAFIERIIIAEKK